MKKAILLIIGCLAYVSVQAQSPVTAAQIKKDVQSKVQVITSEVKFTDVQKEFLTELLVYAAKSKAGNFTEDLKANPIKDVNMDTFFTQEQRNAIHKYKAIQPNTLSRVPADNTDSSKSKF